MKTYDPDFPQVNFAAGLSGHGFKLTPVLGEMLAEMALGLAHRHPAPFLSRARFE